eukprot:1913393-Rhodomonas_salina.1
MYGTDILCDAFRPMFYYIVFFVSAISAMTYYRCCCFPSRADAPRLLDADLGVCRLCYSMWTETAVLHIVEEDGERIVFPARYLDWLITTPLMLAAVSLFGAPLGAC